jgi:hypothetical protein
MPLDLEKTGNLVEAGFWMAFGVVVTLGLWRQARRLTSFGWTSGAICILFGLSDLVEAQTGAWWRPWWLFCWKAACLTAMGICFFKYRGDRAALVLPGGTNPQAPSSSM